jgi:hypothetical protein
MKDSQFFLNATVFMVIITLLQVFGLVRYMDRLPQDWVGIGIYILTIVSFVIVALVFYSRGRKQG